MKKTALLIVLSLVFCLVCACASQPETESFDFSFDSSSAELDFNGREFVIGSTYSDVFRYREGTFAADQAYEKIDAIKKNLNCTVRIYNNGGLQDDVVNSTAAGIDKYSMVYMDSTYLRSLAMGHYLLDINGWGGYVDWTDSFRWGSKRILEISCSEGVLYGVSTSCWLNSLIPFCHFIVANDSIFQQNGFAVPSEYLENQTWNRDTFQQVIAGCYDGNREIFGLEAVSWRFYYMGGYSNGYIPVMPNGSSGLDTAECKTGLEWAVEFWNVNKEYLTETGEDVPEFVEGRAAMGLTDLGRVIDNVTYSDVVKEFTLMNFPAGPAVDADYIGGYLNGNISSVGIMRISSVADEAAFIINELFTPMEGLETIDSLKDYYLKNVFFKQSDVDLIFRAQYSDNIQWSYFQENAWSIGDLCQGSLKNVTSAIESRESKTQAAYELIRFNQQGLDTYFGD